MAGELLNCAVWICAGCVVGIGVLFCGIRLCVCLWWSGDCMVWIEEGMFKIWDWGIQSRPWY